MRRALALLLLALLLPVYAVAALCHGLWWALTGDDGPTVRW